MDKGSGTRMLLAPRILRICRYGTHCLSDYKKLSSMIANKHNQSYNQTINWLRCRLGFSLLRSSIMSIRGSRSSSHHPANPQLPEAAIDRALCDSRVITDQTWILYMSLHILSFLILFSIIHTLLVRFPRSYLWLKTRCV